MFKGGPIFLNSGGMGPDDYLIKPAKGGRWVRVIFRWGRNYDGVPEHAEADKLAAKSIFPLVHVATGDNAKRWAGGKGTIQTMNAEEFVSKHTAGHPTQILCRERLERIYGIARRGTVGHKEKCECGLCMVASIAFTPHPQNDSEYAESKGATK